MSRVVHFEIAAKDPEKSVKFYSDAFGWKFTKWEGPVDYWLAETGDADSPGINGAIMHEGEVKGSVNTLDVPDIKEAAKKIVEAGGTLFGEQQTVPGVGYFIYGVDPNGILFGCMQSDQFAK